eukprot:scaffold12158_cov277-Chaetoceros_neogracile.AAC.1
MRRCIEIIIIFIAIAARHENGNPGCNVQSNGSHGSVDIPQGINSGLDSDRFWLSLFVDYGNERIWYALGKCHRVTCDEEHTCDLVHVVFRAGGIIIQKEIRIRCQFMDGSRNMFEETGRQ